MITTSLYAAIDLGSNSFRLEMGQLEDGHLRRMAYMKETVRQGNGLDSEQHLTPEAMQRGWECLARFAERIAGLDTNQVRAVATQTLREARNRDVFLEKAKTILGFPVEVIAGKEEARLIYLGVSHLLPQSDERRLVIDIGGRSTELILGQHARATTLESWPVGSVAWSMKFFSDGQWTSAAFKAADIAAKAELGIAQIDFQRGSWDACYGASGTVGAVAQVLTLAGWPSDVITKPGLDWLKDKLIKAQKPGRLRMEGLKEERKPVIGGGLTLLMALFDVLQIDSMHVAQGALRQGVLFDLIDRVNPMTDVRSGMINWLAERFGADPVQAERVSRIAQNLFTQLLAGDNTADTERHLRKLDWAARVHEVGMRIAHSNYHKHGAYILDNTDLQGFSVDELHRLSLLVSGHRGKLRKLEAELTDPQFVALLMALRLSVILCHARRDPAMAALHIEWDAPQRSTRLQLSQQWAEQWPQSAHFLREEAIAWQKTDWHLDLQFN